MAAQSRDHLLDNLAKECLEFVAGVKISIALRHRAASASEISRDVARPIVGVAPFSAAGVATPLMCGLESRVDRNHKRSRRDPERTPLLYYELRFERRVRVWMLGRRILLSPGLKARKIRPAPFWPETSRTNLRLSSNAMRRNSVSFGQPSIIRFATSRASR